MAFKHALLGCFVIIVFGWALAITLWTFVWTMTQPHACPPGSESFSESCVVRDSAGDISHTVWSVRHYASADEEKTRSLEFYAMWWYITIVAWGVGFGVAAVMNVTNGA